MAAQTSTASIASSFLRRGGGRRSPAIARIGVSSWLIGHRPRLRIYDNCKAYFCATVFMTLRRKRSISHCRDCHVVDYSGCDFARPSANSLSVAFARAFAALRKSARKITFELLRLAHERAWPRSCQTLSTPRSPLKRGPLAWRLYHDDNPEQVNKDGWPAGRALLCRAYRTGGEPIAFAGAKNAI